MSTPSDTLWDLEPHTRAKHAILRRYLGAWFGIMGKMNQRIVYLDGFCGPGRYKGGEDGSPILAIKLANEHNQRNNLNEIVFIFVEERKDRIEHLKKELSVLPILPSTFHIKTIHNQFDHTMSGLLENIQLRGMKLAPTFAFIDPFGFKGAPYNLIYKLLQNPKTEVFINIMADSINRFLDHPDPQIRNHIVDLFGTSQVLQILNIGKNGLEKMRTLYQNQLEKCARYVRYFEMRDENNRIIYYLFFATNNRLGHVKMKEAFWKVDCSTGYHFSDATNVNQMVLFEEDPSKNLAELINSKFFGQKTTVSFIQKFVEDNTPYLSSHMKKALHLLEDQNHLCVEPCKQNGKKRIKSTFPIDVIVTF